MSKRLAFYWHNGRALGHASRMASIGRSVLSMNPSSSIVAVTGMAKGFEMLGEDIDFIKLPSYSSHDSPKGVQRQAIAQISQSELVSIRSSLVAAFAKSYRPDLWLIDHHPQGWESEMRLAIKETRHALKVLGLRGVMDRREVVNQSYFNASTSKFIVNNYSEIHLYTDPNVFDFADYYRIPKYLVKKIQYTGYVARKCIMNRAEAKNSLGLDSSVRILLANFGGGQATEELWASLMDSLRPLGDMVDLLVFAAGPYLRQSFYERAAARLRAYKPGTVRWARFFTNFDVWIRASDLYVSAGGYNSLADILANEANAVVVPRHMSDSEQQMHARLLAEKGLVRLVGRQELTPERLGALLKESLASPLRPTGHGIRIDGAERSALQLLRLLDSAYENANESALKTPAFVCHRGIL